MLLWVAALSDQESTTNTIWKHQELNVESSSLLAQKKNHAVSKRGTILVQSFDSTFTKVSAPALAHTPVDSVSISASSSSGERRLTPSPPQTTKTTPFRLTPTHKSMAKPPLQKSTKTTTVDDRIGKPRLLLVPTG